MATGPAAGLSSTSSTRKTSPAVTQPSTPFLCRRHPHRRGQGTRLRAGTQLPPPQQPLRSLHHLPSTHLPPSKHAAVMQAGLIGPALASHLPSPGSWLLAADAAGPWAQQQEGEGRSRAGTSLPGPCYPLFRDVSELAAASPASADAVTF